MLNIYSLYNVFKNEILIMIIYAFYRTTEDQVLKKDCLEPHVTVPIWRMVREMVMEQDQARQKDRIQMPKAHSTDIDIKIML